MVKIKSRYLLFEVKWAQQQKFEGAEFKTIIKKAVGKSLSDNFGAWGASCSLTCIFSHLYNSLISLPFYLN